MLRKILIGFFCATLLSSAAVAAEKAPGKKKPTAEDRIVILEKSVDKLEKEVTDLKTVFIKWAASQQGFAPGQKAEAPQQAPTPQSAEIKLGQHVTVLGNPKAPITLVEFSDYECPFCERFHRDSFQRIKKEYIDTGKVKFVYLDVPLSFHANAQNASEAVHCAGEQDKYWEMHDLAFQNTRNLSNLDSIVAQAGINPEKYAECMSSDRHIPMIQDSSRQAQQNGVNGTPSFVVGKSSSDGTLKGALIIGAQPFSAFKQKIDALLQ